MNKEQKDQFHEIKEAALKQREKAPLVFGYGYGFALTEVAARLDSELGSDTLKFIDVIKVLKKMNMEHAEEILKVMTKK